MGYSAFQSNAFQRNAYQIWSGGNVDPVVRGGGSPYPYSTYSYETTKQLYENRRLELEAIEREKLEASRKEAEKEAELARIAAKRESDLADQFLQMQFMKLVKEIEALRNERLRLEYRIKMFMQDEEDLLLILSAMI